MVKKKGVKTLKDCKLFDGVLVKEKDNVVEVAKKLKKFQERRIFVLNSKKYPVGIISIVDINDRVVSLNKNLKKTFAKDIMSSPVNLVLDINISLEEAKKMMIHNNNYYIPIIDKGKLKGLLSYSALIESLKK